MTNPLFATPLHRRALLALPPNEARTITISVYRNHSFELVASVLNPFLALSGVRANCTWAGWDDSLSFSHPPPDADVHLIWIDAGRYTVPDFFDWLRSRAATLRDITGKQVIVCFCGAKDLETPGPAQLLEPDMLFLDCDAVVSPLGPLAHDPRLEPFSGTRYSDQACLMLARELGVRHIPALLFPPLKLLVVDLDNTLHAGVLGEDGPEHIVPHLELQRALAELARQGFLLALVTKNEESDVRCLFASRKDYPLRWNDFSAHVIGWGAKSQAIEKVAGALGVGLDSVLFIDDNPGERLAVSAELPEVHVLPGDSADELLAALKYYPGLYRERVTVEDRLRNADLNANRLRTSLRRKLGRAEYLAELGIELIVTVNDAHHAVRVYELLRKTNQWVFALARPTQGEVVRYTADSERCMVTVGMRDRLSDSGLIGAGLFRVDGPTLLADELAISCRALGRGVEDAIMHVMLQFAAEKLATGPEVAIRYKRGPRNRPALDWLSKGTLAALDDRGTRTLALPPGADLDLAGVTVRRHAAG